MVLRPIEINVRHLSPLWLKFIGLLIFLPANYKLITFSFSEINPFLLIVLNVIAFSIWTGREIVILDFDNRQIKEGYKILGLVVNADTYKFTGIEKMYVNRILTAQTVYQLSTSSTIHDQIYKAFLKTDEGDKFCIGQMRDKDKLIKALKRYNQTIKSTIIDNTLAEPSIIDS
ncbi:MAG: hypothetical protein ABI477_10055 [Chryseolinea sp.]